ncbi:MAG: MbnP family protein [Phycisphaerae bacterium]|jgi:cytochrome c peroxidase
MSRLARPFPLIATLGLAVACGSASAGPGDGARVWLRIRPVIGGAPLRFDDVSLRTAAGQTLSVTRLDSLVGHVRLEGDDGRLATSDSTGFISFGANRDSFEACAAPMGRYTTLAFDVGVAPAINHADPAALGPTDALNPQVNGMHWSWQGGYVFLALEGRYVSGDASPGNELGGYSFHVATDERLMRVRLPVDLTIEGDTLVTLTFDVGAVLGEGGGAIIRIDHGSGTDSTHSAPGDGLARDLASNATRAFRVESARPFDAPPEAMPRAAIEPPPGTTALAFPQPPRFPQPMLPPDNPLTVEGVELGKSLFNEVMLSVDRSQSCATCHVQEHAFTDSPRRVSLGVGGTAGTRNSMPLFNLAWSRSMTWDGKRTRIRDQALAPISDAREMKLPLDEAVARLVKDGDYPGRFERAFGSRGVTAERLSLAIEQYLLTLVSADSKFDRVLAGRETFTEEEGRGLELFIQEYDPARNIRGADCFHCHGGDLFTDGMAKNNGLGVEEAADNGRRLVTGKASDAGKFKTPSLRNVAFTAPYMHDGRFATLEEVVAHYSAGVRRSETLDPNLAKHPAAGIDLSKEDQAALAAFLRALSDPAFAGR